MATAKTADPGRAVLLQDFADVARPLASIEALQGNDVSWLAPLASAAEEDGETLLVRLGPAWAAGHLSRNIRVTLGSRRPRGDGVALSIRWEAAEHPNLFPVLEGDLELVPLGEERSRVILHASYLPPLGGFGRRLDRAVLHRVAESTVRSFVRRLATSLEKGG